MFFVVFFVLFFVVLFVVFELLVMDERCRELVQARGNAAQIRDAALEAGMKLLEDDGMARVLDGMTTVPEVLRVAKPSETM